MSDGDAPLVPSLDLGAFPTSPRRVFGSSAFFRLWIAQVVSSFGDWIGLFGLLAVAERISPGPGSAGLVMLVRVGPGVFLAPLGGVLVDRWDRRRTMFLCDIVRGVVVGLVPYVDNLGELVAASFALEVCTLLWSPAKEASVPNLVPPEKLPAANSLSVAAAYGTFPLASLAFAVLATLASWLGGFDALSGFDVNQESLGLWFDAMTFWTSAALIATLTLPTVARSKDAEPVDWSRAFRELADGLRFIRSHELVRGVMIGVGAGLVGGASIIPLGRSFVEGVLHAGNAGYGLLLTSVGTGVAAGVLVFSAAHRKLARELFFTAGLVMCGIALVLAASLQVLALVVMATAAMGFAGGAAYVCGVTILQEEVTDELRGRTFATFFTVARFSVLFALAAAPFLAGALDSLSEALFDDKGVEFVGIEFFLPGTRLALVAAGLVVVLAGVVSSAEVRRWRRRGGANPSAPEAEPGTPE